MHEYEVEVNRCQGNSASDSRQCMCMDGDRRFFFLCSESIADRRRRHGRKAILSRLSSSSWADRRTATLGTHCMSVGHAGAAGETRSSAGQRRSAGPDRTGRRLVGAGTWSVVSSSSLFRSLWRNDRRTATSRRPPLDLSSRQMSPARSISSSIAAYSVGVLSRCCRLKYSVVKELYPHSSTVGKLR